MAVVVVAVPAEAVAVAAVAAEEEETAGAGEVGELAGDPGAVAFGPSGEALEASCASGVP